MTTRTNLTEGKLRTLRTPPLGKRGELLDSIVPGLSVRCTDKGRKSYMLRARFPFTFDRVAGKLVPWPGPRPQSTRVLLGEVGAMDLETARETARRWLELIEQGVDPRTLNRERPEVSRAVTFGTVAEDFIKRSLKGKRRAAKDEQEIRRELLSVWEHRPVASIQQADLVELIEAIVDRGSPYTAHLALNHARRIWNWAINRAKYGIKSSPCDRVKPSQLIGAKEHRTRELNDEELRALWLACQKVGYPHGRLVQLILLTGARRSEAGEASWSEFDLAAAMWTVPVVRFKSKVDHEVPLSEEAVELLLSCPKYDRGDYVFTTTRGERPVGDYSSAKTALDNLMTEQLGAKTPQWQLHDLRRTVRSGLSRLKIPFEIRERVIGHQPSKLVQTYDRYEFEDEKRDALARWGKRLMSIVFPPPDKVTELKPRKRA